MSVGDAASSPRPSGEGEHVVVATVQDRTVIATTDAEVHKYLTKDCVHHAAARDALCYIVEHTAPARRKMHALLGTFLGTAPAPLGLCGDGLYVWVFRAKHRIFFLPMGAGRDEWSARPLREHVAQGGWELYQGHDDQDAVAIFNALRRNYFTPLPAPTPPEAAAPPEVVEDTESEPDPEVVLLGPGRPGFSIEVDEPVSPLFMPLEHATSNMTSRKTVRSGRPPLSVTPPHVAPQAQRTHAMDGDTPPRNSPPPRGRSSTSIQPRPTSLRLQIPASQRSGASPQAELVEPSPVSTFTLPDASPVSTILGTQFTSGNHDLELDSEDDIDMDGAPPPLPVDPSVNWFPDERQANTAITQRLHTLNERQRSTMATYMRPASLSRQSSFDSEPAWTPRGPSKRVGRVYPMPAHYR